jgi:hypothetical protein
LLTAAVALPLAQPAPGPREPDKTAVYLPTAVGDELVFEKTVDGTREELPRWVTAVEARDGVVIVSFGYEKSGASQYQYEASTDGVFRVPRADGAVRPFHRLLKLPHREGDTWEEEPRSDDDDPTTKYTTGKAEVVEVPAGKFTAVRVEAVTRANGGTARITYWWAAGVGMVKKVVRGPGVDEVRVLKLFTPAKK